VSSVIYNRTRIPRDEAFLFDPSRVGGLGANRIHGFHPWLLKLDPAGVLYLSHPERSEGSPPMRQYVAKMKILHFVQRAQRENNQSDKKYAFL